MLRQETWSFTNPPGRRDHVSMKILTNISRFVLGLNRDKVRSGIIQIGQLALAKRAVDVLVGRMHDKHDRNTGGDVCEAVLQKTRFGCSRPRSIAK